MTWLAEQNNTTSTQLSPGLPHGQSMLLGRGPRRRVATSLDIGGWTGLEYMFAGSLLGKSQTLGTIGGSTAC
jgi:hypothetical protein